MRNVRTFRSLSKRISTLAIANTPERYNVEVLPDRPFLVIPEVSSERRAYVPIGWLEPPTIPSNLVRVLVDADLWHFGVLTSAMHMAWLRQIGGRLKSDYRYSIGIVYNTFPWPDATDEQRARIRTLAQSVLDARKEFPNSTLADLYDVDVMPHQLRKAHQDLDRAVDRLYLSALTSSTRKASKSGTSADSTSAGTISTESTSTGASSSSPRAVSGSTGATPSLSGATGGFTGDRDRVEHLFSLYERLIAPLAAAITRPRKRPSTKKM
jgi:hypothetical protein